jgi:hypothetical protein
MNAPPSSAPPAQQPAYPAQVLNRPYPGPPLTAPALPPPPPPPLFSRRWPLRWPIAGNEAIVAILVTGVVAAITIPLDRPGLGWLLTGVAMGVGVVTVAVLSGAADRRAVVAQRVGWGLAALALLGVGFVRAAGWLFFLALVAAVLCGILAVSVGRTWTGIVLSLFWYPTAVVRGIAWVTRRASPGEETSGGGGDRTLRTGMAVLVSIVLLFVFGALFASADPAFDKVISAILPDIDAGTPFRWVFLFTLFALATAGAVFLVVNPHSFGDIALPPGKPLRRIEWALPVGALVALFGLFVGVQFTVLFGDRDYVMQTSGLTFAEYARSGFGQLVAVTILTLIVIAVAARKAPRATASDRVVLRVILGALAACTLVVVGSALSRMWVYEQEYGFTRLRVLVSAFELWLGVVFVLILGAGVTLKANWLPRAVLATGVATLIGLAILNPDRFIADQNVDRYLKTGRIDVAYLRNLSADAAPALDRLEGGQRDCALLRIADDLRDRPDDWREFNLARYQARAIVKHVELIHCAFR